MAFQTIKKSEVPSTRAERGLPRAAVRLNGQMAFNASATKAFGTNRLVLVNHDKKTHQVQVVAYAKAPKGFEDGDMYKLGYSDKTKSAYFSAADLLKLLKYDYAKSGNQTFAAIADETTKSVTFDLPEGALTPSAKRPRKVKTVAAVASGNGSTKTAPVKDEDNVDEDDV